MTTPKLKQRRWQLEHILAGNCQCCGKPRKESLSKVLCRPCAIKNRLRSRAFRKCNPWKPGGPGRPPLEHAKEWWQ